MPPKTEKSQSASESKKYYLRLSGIGVIGLFLFIFGISGWMFWLGLQVGMENAPVRFDMKKIEEELASLKEAVNKGKQMLLNRSSEASAQRPELKFYEILRDPEPVAPQVQIDATAPKPLTSDPVMAEKPVQEAATQVVDQNSPAALMLYTIQVASLRTLEDAEQMVKRLKKKGYPSYYAAIEIAEKGRWYRVRVGSFKDRTDAQKIMERLKNDKYQTLLVKL